MLKIILVTLSLMTLTAHSADRDKWLHFGVSSVISSGVYLHTKRVKPAMVSCMTIGLSKELIDQGSPRNRKGFDHKDMAANLLGCYVGIKLVDTIFRFDLSKNTIHLRATWRF